MSTEASLEAIAGALEVGVDLVEFDVRISRDGVFLTAHDAEVQTPDGRVRIEDLTASEVLSGGLGAATVTDVLKLLRGRAKAHVDLKDTGHEVEIADLCEKLLGPDGFILTTLEDSSVKRIRDERPHLQIALSLGRDAAGLSTLRTLRLRLSELFPGRRVKACNPTMLAINHKLARRGVLRWAYRKGIPVLVWTLNSPELMRWAWCERRIWGFVTDNPRMALRTSRPT